VELFSPEMMSWILGDCQTTIEFLFFFMMLLLLMLMLNDDGLVFHCAFAASDCDSSVPSGRQANKLKICELGGE
jgi:hypothetical protein